MKKNIVLATVVAVGLSSCNYKTAEHKRLEMKYDSIEAVQQKQTADLDLYLGLIEEIEAGFDSIRVSQGYLSIGTNAENTPLSVRERVEDGMALINMLLVENSEKIAELQEQVNNGNIQSAQLKKTIAKLNAALEQKMNEVVELRAELEAKNFKIDSLSVENAFLSSRISTLNAENESLGETLAKQDSMLNTGYYIVASNSELKKKGIDVRRLKSGFDASLFTAVDVRLTDEIVLGQKRCKILTQHPAGSYEIERNAERDYVLRIKDKSGFWNPSKYLVVQN